MPRPSWRLALPTRRRHRSGPPSRSRGVAVRRVVAVLIAALLLPGAAVLLGAPPASAATIASGIQLRGAGGNCLTAERNATFAPVRMYTCDGRATQNWNIIGWSGANGLQLAGSNLCVGTSGNFTAETSQVVLRPCNPTAEPSTQWATGELQTGLRKHIRDARPGVRLCLDVAYASTNQGSPVWTYHCNDDSDAQSWAVGRAAYVGRVLGVGNNCLATSLPYPKTGDRVWMEPCNGAGWQKWVRFGAYLMLGGKCLDIRGPSLAEGTPVQLYSCYDVPQQHWQQLSTGVVKSELGNVCLDVDNGGTASGTQVWSWSCNETYAQGWYLDSLPTDFVHTEAAATQLNGAMLSRLADCQGMIRMDFGATHVVVMKNPAPFVVRRPPVDVAIGPNGESWPVFSSFSNSARTAASGWANRATMNGQFFSYPGYPKALQPQGDIHGGGQPNWDTPFPEGYLGFTVSAAVDGGCAGQWSIGPQVLVEPHDPPDSVDRLGGRAPAEAAFAMGGARPLVIGGQRWSRDDEKQRYPTWHPAAGHLFDYYEPANVGKPTIGVRGDGLVMMIVQQDGAIGQRLSAIREAYVLQGFKDAVMFDGGSSSTLAVNGSSVVRPVAGKEPMIPTGLAMATR